jgi:NADH-quinone oxidoreductase subunit F
MVKECSLCGLGQTAPNPVLTTMKYFRHEYEQHIRAKRCEAGVCEELFTAPCENRCPLHMRIPGYLQLTKEKRFDEAAEMVWRDNPLPASTGRVCQHPCESLCRRGALDAPVNMREVHRFLADTVMEDEQFGRIQASLVASRLPASGKKVNVAGAGPAGLTMAFYLALLGHQVTVYEEKPAAGGMLRYSLPEYRLPKALLDREIEMIRRLGVKFVFNCRVGADMTLDEISGGADAAFLSTGTWQETSPGLEGEDGPGVWHAIELLDAVAKGEAPELGHQVMVIGGGNAAIDSARTATRLGAHVRVLYRRAREDMPAIAEEVEDAEAEGVDVRFFVAPQRVVRDAEGNVTGIEMMQMKPGAFDRSGRRRPEPTGERQLLSCTGIVLAVGEVPDTEQLSAQGVPVNRKGRVVTDPVTMGTTKPSLYAGGDLVHGATNVTVAMGSAKQACRAIDRLLCGEDRLDQVLGTFTYDMELPPDTTHLARHLSPHLDPGKRKQGFDEVLLGIGRDGAVTESCRCLRCDVKEVCSPTSETQEEAGVFS